MNVKIIKQVLDEIRVVFTELPDRTFVIEADLINSQADMLKEIDKFKLKANIEKEKKVDKVKLFKLEELIE